MIERDKEYYNQKISELYKVIENQEKIIGELQEKSKSTYYITDDEYIKITESHCSNLQQRIDKAIEYIEENQYQHEWTDRFGFTCRDDRYILNDSQDVLEILKGDNNE